MKRKFLGGKSSRTKIFTLITAVLCVLILALNLTLTFIGNRYTVFADLTREGFYTLSDKMEETCEEILEAKEEDGTYRLKQPIKMIFCDDPDNLVANKDTRITYYMALDIMNRFDNFEVETVNVRNNPAAVAMYKTTSLDTISSTDVIITYGAKYRVATANWWTGEYFSYNGEYSLASIMASLTAVSQPAVYFVTGHGESFYDPENPKSEESLKYAALADLLNDCGFKIKTVNLSAVDVVPEDCTLLIINDPKTDFTSPEDDFDSYSYVSELEKLDRYLVKGSGSVIINKDYRRQNLKALESFCAEWGISFGNMQLRDPGSALDTLPSTDLSHGSSIIATYDTGEYSLGAAYYGKYASLASAPKMVFTDTGYVYCSFEDGDVDSEPGNMNVQKTFASFIGTTEEAAGYESANSSLKLSPEGKKSLAAMTVRVDLDSYDGEKEYSYFFVSNTKDFFSEELLGNRSYANRDIVATLIQNISRTETHASIELGGSSYNSSSFGGKQTVSSKLNALATDYHSGNGSYLGTNKAFTDTEKVVFTIVAAAAPVVILILGAGVYIRRKFL